MPYYVNGQLVPEDLIHREAAQISRDPRWSNITDQAERVKRLRAVAEWSAQDKVLIAQAAANDPRPIDPQLIEQQVERLKENGNYRGAFDQIALRQIVEHGLRAERTMREITEGAPEPTAEEIEAFYHANRENFRAPERFRAAHIVKYVNEAQSEEQAEAGIGAALAELDRGEPFAEVAERHSDCKGNGGELPDFPAGEMVEEFENAIRALEPGRRTDIIVTPFGFHIAKLIARIPAGVAPFEDCRQDIQNAFTMRRRHERYLRAVAGLRSRAEIRFVPEGQVAVPA